MRCKIKFYKHKLCIFFVMLKRQVAINMMRCNQRLHLFLSKVQSTFFFIFFILVLCFYDGLAQCPPVDPPCRCAPSIYEPIAIICKNAKSLVDALRAVRKAKNSLVDSLTIADTPIAVLLPNVFAEFFILRLVLNRNQLTEIDANAFDGPLEESLIELDLSDNNLKHIPKNGVPKLRNLRKLYLNRNRISGNIQPDAFQSYASRKHLFKLELAANKLTDKALSTNVFRPLKNLRELSLETNALSSIPSFALVNQQNSLTNLNLGLNQIKEIPIGALNFSQLNSLSLEFNGITAIIPQAFQGVSRLQYLYLTGNKFPIWQPEMFRYTNDLRTLGIGETPISVIPFKAFVHTPSLMRLEMSEAAVDVIEFGVFQHTPLLQAIVFNKNRLTKIYTHMFKGLLELYSIDLQGNRIMIVEPFAFSNLPSLRHLDISYNQLKVMPFNTFANSFEPLPDDRRVIYACSNPWLCDSRLEWFRQVLRNNLDIDIDKPGCVTSCGPSPTNCPPVGTPLRSQDYCPIAENPPLSLSGNALLLVGWIILAVILTILLISILLMSLIRYAMSHKRKREKNQEIEDYQRIISLAASCYPTIQPLKKNRLKPSVLTLGPSSRGISLDLPPAHNLDDRQNCFI